MRITKTPKIEGAQQAEACVQYLEALIEDRGRLAAVPLEVRNRLLMAAGRVSHPSKLSKRNMVRAVRRRDRMQVRNHDERLFDQTGIRKLRLRAVYPTPQLPPPAPAPALDLPELLEASSCYICKRAYREVHHFYDQLCPPCADANWQKRFASADLTDRVALVTGGRVKIGYQAVIKLLRAGAGVIVTTRFPRDAARRFAEEEDFASFSERLSVFGLDLRHTPSVEAFAAVLAERGSRLDIIINNACQTVRRPAGYYEHLMTEERNTLSRPADALVQSGAEQFLHSSEMSQIKLLPEDLATGNHIFPTGKLDADLQQVDLRGINSWRLPLCRVSTVELLETTLVNAIAPFVLNARLKPLMLATRAARKYVVNVSAVEGQFYRSFKTDKHPHTNMAKAALNMMTRTSAPDYAQDGIFMNSVDTGWVTDEDPVHIAARKVTEHRFSPPLDIVDGAARICDPVFAGEATGQPVWGQFLKDYQPTDW